MKEEGRGKSQHPNHEAIDAGVAHSLGTHRIMAWGMDIVHPVSDRIVTDEQTGAEAKAFVNLILSRANLSICGVFASRISVCGHPRTGLMSSAVIQRILGLFWDNKNPGIQRIDKIGKILITLFCSKL